MDDVGGHPIVQRARGLQKTVEPKCVGGTSAAEVVTALPVFPSVKHFQAFSSSFLFFSVSRVVWPQRPALVETTVGRVNKKSLERRKKLRKFVELLTFTVLYIIFCNFWCMVKREICVKRKT